MTLVNRHVGGVAAAAVRACDERPADDMEGRETAVDDDEGGEEPSVGARWQGRKDAWREQAKQGRRSRGYEQTRNYHNRRYISSRARLPTSPSIPFRPSQTGFATASSAHVYCLVQDTPIIRRVH